MPRLVAPTQVGRRYRTTRGFRLQSASRMRKRLALVLSLALLTGCGDRAGEERGGERRRLAGAAAGWNVVLVSVDTLRADRLGAYGYAARPTSPAIDGLLGSGVAFEQAMAQRSTTWPSLASVLTGLYPSGHGVVQNGYGFPDQIATLPEVLGAAGYRTAAFLSNMCQANHQGWDDFACAGGQDGKTLRRALEWAEARAPESGTAQPFFLWVHLFGAHSPYYNGGDLAARQLDPGYDGPLGPKKWQLDRVMTEPLRLTARDVRHLDALYDAAVMGSDRHVGSLLAGLRQAGRLERTVVVFLSDHGEELYDHHGYLYHACSVYQTALHVPLAFAAPELLPAGSRVPQTVELVDVTPTLLDLLGVAPPAGLHGRSLVPYLERPGAGGAGKPAFSEYHPEVINTVLFGGWKLVANPRAASPVCMEGAPAGHYPIAERELYDLSRDPGETENLAAAQPAKVAELLDLLRERFAGMARQGGPQEISPELRKELEALGYVAN